MLSIYKVYFDRILKFVVRSKAASKVILLYKMSVHE